MPLPVIPSDDFVASHMSEEMPRPTDPIIPRQRLSSLIRWPLRLLITPFILIDLTAQKMARMIVRPPYKRAGSCKQRGACCYYILIEERKGLLGRFYLWWQREVNGFYSRNYPPVEEGKQRFIVMGCRYLLRSGKCAHYRTRPMVCRKWPVIERFGSPQVLKGCGFKAELRKSVSSRLK